MNNSPMVLPCLGPYFRLEPEKLVPKLLPRQCFFEIERLHIQKKRTFETFERLKCFPFSFCCKHTCFRPGSNRHQAHLKPTSNRHQTSTLLWLWALPIMCTSTLKSWWSYHYAGILVRPKLFAYVLVKCLAVFIKVIRYFHLNLLIFT